MDRQRTDTDSSTIELDTEFIRPRFSLVFSLAAIFILILLNVTFWYEYLQVIIWAVAASQLIRPLTEDVVRAATRVQKAKLKNSRRSLLLLFYENVVKYTPEPLETNDKSLKPNGRRSLVRFFVECSSFVFKNPTLFLSVVMAFHLMPLHVFFTLFTSLILVIVFVSILSDLTGLTNVLLRLLKRPDVVSTLVIGGLVLFLVVVDMSIAVATFFELADLAYRATNVLAQFLESLSSNSQAVVVTSLSPNVLWAKENAVQMYQHASRQFGERKWWPVVESIRHSLETRTPPEVMARAALDELHQVYNGTEWLGLVEMAVMATVPQQRTLPHFSKFTIGSIQSVWLSVGETLWRFSALIMDVLKVLGLIAGQVFLFIFIVQQLCKSSRDVITVICILTCPTSTRARNQLNSNLQMALRNTFTDAMFYAHKSSLVVLIVYGVLGMPCAFISSCFVYFSSLLHIIPDTWSLLAISLPWLFYHCLNLYLLRDHLDDVQAWVGIIKSIILPLGLIQLNRFANQSWRHKSTARSQLVSPWLLDFSLAVGMGHFGVNGVILGPFLASVSSVVLDFVIRVAEQDLDFDDEFIIKKRQSQLGMSGLNVADNSILEQPFDSKRDGHEQRSSLIEQSPLISQLGTSPGRISSSTPDRKVETPISLEETPISSKVMEQEEKDPLELMTPQLPLPQTKPINSGNSRSGVDLSNVGLSPATTLSGKSWTSSKGTRRTIQL